MIEDAARNRLFIDSNGDALDLAALNIQVNIMPFVLLLMLSLQYLCVFSLCTTSRTVFIATKQNTQSLSMPLSCVLQGAEYL